MMTLHGDKSTVYFRVINTSYCIQYGCFVTSRFVLAPCVRYGYNSFKKLFCCAIVLRGIRTLVLSFVCLSVIFNS